MAWSVHQNICVISGMGNQVDHTIYFSPMEIRIDGKWKPWQVPTLWDHIAVERDKSSFVPIVPSEMAKSSNLVLELKLELPTRNL